MFLDTLSATILRLCYFLHLSYEAASERCDLSSRYFASIARGKTAPTIRTLEKLCIGFNLTPNELLLPEKLILREPMPVREIRRYACGDAYPVCPCCRRAVEREFQSYCDRCGQALDWNTFIAFE